MAELSRPILRSDLRRALASVEDLRTRYGSEQADKHLDRIERTLTDAYDTLVADELAALAQAEAQ